MISRSISRRSKYTIRSDLFALNSCGCSDTDIRRLDETVPKKRIILSYSIPPTESLSTANALMSYFLRLPDTLVSTRIRPEIRRKIQATRDDEIRKLKKADDEEKEEKRREERDRSKKEERERKLKGMNADEQRKFLEKERERDTKKNMKRQTRRG